MADEKPLSDQKRTGLLPNASLPLQPCMTRRQILPGSCSLRHSVWVVYHEWNLLRARLSCVTNYSDLGLSYVNHTWSDTPRGMQPFRRMIRP